jgi:stress response protein YsnF
MPKDPEPLPRDEAEELVIPVVEEELVAGTRSFKTGGVRVEKVVQKRLHKIEAPVLHEEVEVRHVPVNRVVKEIPQTRTAGDTVIVPVVVEELVVTKRLILKEEIHLIKRRTKGRAVKQVELERERAVVRRLDAQGKPVEPRRTRTATHRSVLD